MWQLGLICAFLAGANAAIAGASAGASSGSTGSGLYTSNYIGNGYGSQYPYLGGGYTNGYAGTGFAPIFPVVPPYAGFGFNNDLNRYINQYFNALQANFQSLYAQQFAQQQELFNNINAYATNPNYQQAQGSNSYAPNYSAAAAGASIGPQGGYQSASIYPGNPHQPNINTRFGPGESVHTSTSGGGPGYHGVSTFVSSGSSDNNGHRTGFREAVTSVNDNGRVSTYRVHS